MKRSMKSKNKTDKKKSVKDLATKKYVKEQIVKHQELKYYDETLSDFIDYNGAVYCLTDMAQGLGDSQRVGDKISIKSMLIRGTLAEADLRNIIRIIIFQWYPVDSASAPVPAQILQAIGTWGIVSPYIHDTRNQFGILVDKMYNLNTSSTPYRPFEIRVPLKYAKKSVNFNAAGLFGSNHICALVITDSSASTHPTVSFYTRVYYTDS